jgi:hypothetical protein
LKPCEETSIRMLIVSDTHNRHESLVGLPVCDIFIHCGDILMVGKFYSEQAGLKKLMNFNNWLGTIVGFYYYESSFTFVEISSN